jgi:hypothetical protein
VYKWKPSGSNQEVIYVNDHQTTNKNIRRASSIRYPPRRQETGYISSVIAKRRKSQSTISSSFEKRILIVDDQSFNIEALLIILKYKVGLDSNQLCDKALSG